MPRTIASLFYVHRARPRDQARGGAEPVISIVLQEKITVP
jgi:hypothetical protein